MYHLLATRVLRSRNGLIGEVNLTTSRSMALQALYGTDAVGETFQRLSLRDESGDIILYSDDGSDDDDVWEDNMDSITFAQYYAGPLNPHFVKMV